MTPLVFHIPHSSTVIPPSDRQDLLLDSEMLAREVRRMTDHHTDKLFDVPGLSVARVVFPVSRLVLDPERFADDAREPMAARGMGVVYEKTADLEPLRNKPSAEERKALIDRYYHPHHQRLALAVEQALSLFGCALIIDCHSFPSVPIPYENDQDPDRPDICIGTDSYHTPGGLAAEAAAIFERAGFRVALNRPFSGTLVPMKYYRRELAVSSIMIELNRGLYMDEKAGVPLPKFEILRQRLAGCLIGLAMKFEEIGRIN
jgi:N-formylglutamate amidohydrolase